MPLQQHTPCFTFVGHYGRNNAPGEFFEQTSFGHSQCSLIGNLEPIASGFAAFAVESAHREVQFLGGALDLLNFIGDAQCAQVHHDADADSASHIGWARSQIAPLGMKCKVKTGAQCRVHTHRGIECLAEQVAGTQHLNAHVVFLIHHE